MKNYILLLLFCFLIFSCKKEGKTVKIDEKLNVKIKKIDSLFNDAFSKNIFNGNVLIAEKGLVLYEKSFGIANEKTKEKLDIKTIFELASVSKQFTAMGIVQLQKQGKLSYNDSISKYIPELSKYRGITIKNLLTHTAGLPDYMRILDKEWDKNNIATNNDVIEIFNKIEPQKEFEPNEKWKYSNTGYLILATIIERVSGKKFGEYLNKVVFKPLKMNNTFIYQRRFLPMKVENYAQGYIYSDSLKRKILPDELGKDFLAVYLDGIVGDGMVNSNLEDLLKWDRALYNDKIISDEDRKMIFSSYKTTNNKNTDYGFGWMIDSTEVYGKIVSHSGGWAGYVAYIERHLDTDKTIIILQNNSMRNTVVPVKNIRKILYNQKIEKPIQLDSKFLKLYAGKYSNNNNNNNNNNKIKVIAFEDNKLYVLRSGGFKMRLIPVSKTKFIVEGYSPEVTYEFFLNANNKVEKYRVQQEASGLDKEVKRVE